MKHYGNCSTDCSPYLHGAGTLPLNLFNRESVESPYVRCIEQVWHETCWTLMPKCKSAQSNVCRRACQLTGDRSMPERKSTRRSQKGFSLVEVLICMVIVAVGLLALAGMQITSIKGNALSRKVTQATVLAQNKMEELKRLPFTDPSLSSGCHSEGTLSGTVFSRSYQIEDLSATLKAITVTVQWADEIDHRISLSTMKAR